LGVEHKEIIEMTSVQIPFDIPVREAFEAEDYLVTPSNEAAVHWLDRWPRWPNSHCVILYGTIGCGKTHLSHVWQNKSNATSADINDLDMTNLLKVPCNIIIEDIDSLLDTTGVPEKLFHLYNWQKETGSSLMLTASQHPKYWPVSLPDLKSRMLAAMALEIGPPDEDLLTAVMVKQFADRQINIPMEVVLFLIPRMERSFEAVRDMVRRIDKLALSQKRKITIPLVRDLLSER